MLDCILRRTNQCSQNAMGTNQTSFNYYGIYIPHYHRQPCKSNTHQKDAKEANGAIGSQRNLKGATSSQVDNQWDPIEAIQSHREDKIKGILSQSL